MLPIEFSKRMKRLLGDESEAFFKALEEEKAVRSFRVNGIKASVEDIEHGDISLDRKKADFPPECYYTEEAFPGYLPCHHSGMIYMQDPSAMATVHAVKIEKGIKALDSCSAPGGKTTQICEAVGEYGIVVANEYDAKRCRILQGNVERMGAKTTVVVNHDTAVLAETYPEVFDLVLCDAPCSGEGMFRKNSLAIDEWSIANVEMCADRQREILNNVAKCVKIGGKLIYSTCTFSLEENEMNVAWFLDNFSDFVLVDVEDELKKATKDGITFEGCRYDMAKTRRFYPHVSRGEGQFIAVFERVSGENPVIKSDKNSKKDKKGCRVNVSKEELELLKSAESFLEDNLKTGALDGLDLKLFALNGYAYLKPDIALPEYGVYAAGVCVGEVQGRRFLPHHQLFSAFGKDFKRQIHLKSGMREAEDYLRGLEISCGSLEIFEDKAEGYAAVICDGCALGGGKISGGVCKNHYPKGLRNQK